MCESTVYLLKGSERVLLMPEAARVMVTGDSITCFDTLGERKVFSNAKLVEANLVKHEIILKSL